MLVQTGYQKLDLAGKHASTTSMLTTGNVDLNANGVAITNIKSLESASGAWSVDEPGRIVAKVLCLDGVCIDKGQLQKVLDMTNSSSTVATSTSSGGTQENGTTTGNGTTSETSSSTPQDTIPPVVSLVGNSNMSINVGDTYVELGAVSVDNVDGDISGNIIISGTVDNQVAGIYNIVYNSTDSSNNLSSITRSIEVISQGTTTPQ